MKTNVKDRWVLTFRTRSEDPRNAMCFVDGVYSRSTAMSVELLQSRLRRASWVDAADSDRLQRALAKCDEYSFSVTATVSDLKRASLL